MPSLIALPPKPIGCPVIFFIGNITILFSADKIESVPLINLEELSPTFEEDKDELENKDLENASLNTDENFSEEKLNKKKEKIYINIKALDKITAKTLAIKLGIGEKKYFGSLEIKGLKSINIHAASPKYPGRDPHHFAIYDNPNLLASVSKGSSSLESFKDKISGCLYKALSSKLILASRHKRLLFFVKTKGFISIRLASFSTKIL